MVGTRGSSKTYLKILMVVGVLALAGGGAGTFASFTAQTTNPDNYFATGTLFLHNTKGATTCTSESASGNLNNGTNGDTCATLFTVALDGTTTAQSALLTLHNDGTIAGQHLQVSGSCTDTKTVALAPQFGTTTLCNGLALKIREVDAADAVIAGCAFPAAGCTSGTPLDALGTPTNLTLQNGAGAGNTTDQLSPSGTRYFRVEVAPPVGASFDNSYQNRKATFDLNWTLTEA